MSWTGKPAPSPVTSLHVSRGLQTDVLSWQGARDRSGAGYLVYNVYASDTYPVDIKDARNLLVTRQRESSVTVPHKGRALHYAVTATDRYGNESTPKLSTYTAVKDRKPIDFRELIIGRSNKQIKKRK